MHQHVIPLKQRQKSNSPTHPSSRHQAVPALVGGYKVILIILVRMVIGRMVVVMMGDDGEDDQDDDDYVGAGDETDRLKAVLCAVRQWLRFQLHREAGAAKNQSLITFSKAKSLILEFSPGRVGE